jgi:hypothetical protein
MAASSRTGSHHTLLSLFLLGAAACSPGGTQSENMGGAPAGPAGGSGGTAPPAMGGSTPTNTGPIPLPMSVTAQFQNQGWFADPALEKFFQPGSMVIRQVDGTSGPCAMRMAQARGKCVKVTYTPPSGLVPPPTGGWVGVFFLTTVSNDHPEASPPVRVGDANWGIEPGRNVAPGATRISFLGAAEQEGVAVTFKAGTDKDSFVVPDQREVLGTAWKSYSLPLMGASYGSSVVGAFAWVLNDTTKPATFYLDSIVWE